VGEEEGVGPKKSHKTHNIQYSKQNTEYRMQNTEYSILGTAAAKLMYIKLPMYLFSIWPLDLMIVMGQIHFQIQISTFLGPNGTRFARGYFRAKNFSIF
jgi:hypothetical protein